MTMRHAGALATALATALAAALLAGCGAPPPAPTRPVNLQAEIRLPAGTTPAGKVYVGLYQAWSLTGELRHPLQLIESFEAAPGAVRHQFDYPENGGEGLVVYAWVDVDGDAVLCTPASRTDLAGLAEVQAFPADDVSVVLDLSEPCRGPEWFYPRAGS